MLPSFSEVDFSSSRGELRKPALCLACGDRVADKLRLTKGGTTKSERQEYKEDAPGNIRFHAEAVLDESSEKATTNNRLRIADQANDSFTMRRAT